MIRVGVTSKSFTVAVVSVALVAACSGETSSGELVDTAESTRDATGAEPATDDALIGAASAVFGPGRAEQVHPLEGGGLVVVTTTGIDVVESPESPTRRIADFTGPGTVGPSVVTADGNRLIVATSSPNTISSYDLSSGDVLSQSTSETDVREIVDRGDGAPIIVATAGLFALPDDGSAPVALASAADTGRIATVGERVIALDRVPRLQRDDS